jgi:hypothetical protein
MVGDETNSIERRLRALEDQIAIYQVVCGYGYAIDGCDASMVGSLYAEDGVYAVGDRGTRPKLLARLNEALRPL